MIRRIDAVCKAHFLGYSLGVRKLEGLSASPGIVVGPVFRYADEAAASIPRYEISPRDADLHWGRFDAALEKSRREIGLLIDGRNKEQSDILEAQLLMLTDPEFIPQVREELYRALVNIESVLQLKVESAAAMLRATGDTYLSERAVDIEDAFGRVMVNLLQAENGAMGKVGARFVPPGTILVARNIRPSEALSLRDSGIVGIALEEGGATSHVAILARSWKIPAVMGVRGLLDLVSDGDEVILDGADGVVIVEPAGDAVSRYRSRATSESRLKASEAAVRAALIEAPAETLDGARMTLRANIAVSDEALDAKLEGAEGIGLFRSEFLFLASDSLPDEETQYAEYRRAVESMDGAPVVIRTLDAGADKLIDDQKDYVEKNPLLGWRAIRYCLDRRDVFRTQLRALLRASAHGDLRVMFPMIANLGELEAALCVLDEAKGELSNANVPFNRKLKVGIMIEIPAAAVCADQLAKKVDFMSIGTNDLIQYTMAVDRENARVAHLYDCFNPAVLRLVRMTIAAGIDARVDVSMCGEMAGDPVSAFLLMGMGLRNFSMSPALVTPVKEMVRKVSLRDAIEAAQSALELSAPREIRKLLQERLKTYE